MARLNEPPAPATESVEALKRRFIRQNRELARVNSTQSLRIRNLEAEISRLLAENISVREQAINTAQEAERWRSSYKLVKEVASLKDRLGSKMLEVTGIVAELGALHEKAVTTAHSRSSSGQQHQRRRSGAVDEVAKSPDQQDWKNRQTITGALGREREWQQEGKLPVIVEDKYYPRRTLETSELQRMIGNEDGDQASESPDLGPPPVAHFEVADPIKFHTTARKAAEHNSRQLENSEEDDKGSSNNNNPAPIPSNLEMRRKRRASSFLVDMPVLQSSSSSTTTDHAAESIPTEDRVLLPLKSGAKRKLGAREEDEEDDLASTTSNRDDEFSFQRKSSTASSTPLPRSKSASSSRFSRPTTQQQVVLEVSNEDEVEKKPPASQKNDAPPRKALGPKSTNVSPSKPKNSTSIDDKIAALKKDVANQAKAREARAKDKKPRAATTPALPPSSAQADDINTKDIVLDDEQVGSNTNSIDHPPKTPAGLDLFSPPTSTNPSIRDTRTMSEMAISTSVEDVLGSMNEGRGSRRARAGISYAQPNLRDKMRRPGKEFVPAVADVDRFKERESSVTRTGSIDHDPNNCDDEAAAADVTKMRTVVVKREKPSNADTAWKSLPEAQSDEAPSPLKGKAGNLHSQSRQSPDPRVMTESVSEENHLENAVSRLTIFDGPLSSPGKEDQLSSELPTDSAQDDAGDNVSVTAASIEHASKNIKLRRHFTNSAKIESSRTSTVRSSAPPEPSLSGPDQSRSKKHGPDASEQPRQPPRPSSAAALRKESGSQKLGSATAQADLKRSTSVAGLGGLSRHESERTERAAARRRSMMI